MLSERLGLGPRVVAGLGQVFERWDGRGAPHKLRGEALALPVRVSQLARDIELGAAQAGPGWGGGPDAPARRQGPRPPAGAALREGTVGDGRRPGQGFDLAGGAGRRAGTPPAPVRRAAGRGLARGGRVRRHEVRFHPRALRGGGRPGPGGGGKLGLGPADQRSGRASRPPARSGPGGRVRLRLGQGRPADGRRVGTGSHAQLLHRTGAVPAGGAGHGHRRRQPGARTPRRQRVPPAAVIGQRAGAGPGAGGGRRLPGFDVGAAPPRRPWSRTPPPPS